MSQSALVTAVLLIVSLLVLTACGPGQQQIQIHGYGSTYTQFGRD